MRISDSGRPSYIPARGPAATATLVGLELPSEGAPVKDNMIGLYIEKSKD